MRTLSEVLRVKGSDGETAHMAGMSLQKVVHAVHVLLAIVPLLAAESRHARMCSSKLQLWNDAIVIENPTLFADVWLGTLAACVLIEYWYYHKKNTHKHMPPLRVKRELILLTLLTIFRLIKLNSQSGPCLYSFPLCGTTLFLCEAIMYFAKSKQSIL